MYQKFEKHRLNPVNRSAQTIIISLQTTIPKNTKYLDMMYFDLQDYSDAELKMIFQSIPKTVVYLDFQSNYLFPNINTNAYLEEVKARQSPGWKQTDMEGNEFYPGCRMNSDLETIFAALPQSVIAINLKEPGYAVD